MMRLDRRTFGIGLTATACACTALPKSGGVDAGATQAEFPVERFSSRMTDIIDPGIVPEVVASGFDWTEGPAWDQKRNQLYFSDAPRNHIHTWSRENGLGLWRSASGSQTPPPAGIQPGTNGLLYLPREDALLVCDHPSRSVLKYDLGKGGEGVPFASGGEGASFNSPNDLVMDAEGGLYFTDPPYGLMDGFDSSLKERTVNGVYYRAPDGAISLVDGSMKAPNGIGLSPNGDSLYVAVSEREAPRIERYQRSGGKWVKDGKVFQDFLPRIEAGYPGNADGMAITTDGTLFATSPAAVSIISAEGELLGRIHTGRATGNCTFGEDGTVLFVTSDDVLLRVPTKLKSLGFA